VAPGGGTRCSRRGLRGAGKAAPGSVVAHGWTLFCALVVFFGCGAGCRGWSAGVVVGGGWWWKSGGAISCDG
jgi:hypothetical protein